MSRIRVSIPNERGTYTAALDADGTVVISLEGGFVGQGYWRDGTLDIWDRLLSDDVRGELSRKLAEAQRR